MNETIKECPFCGHKTAPRIIKWTTVANMYTNSQNINNDDEEGSYIICDAINGGCGGMSGYGLKKEYAIQKWNKRYKKLSEKLEQFKKNIQDQIIQSHVKYIEDVIEDLKEKGL